ncbi:ROK family transcriptional regulator [Microlunatus sp. GCM10028923]|uniref:ROK family transcriptional regulator n=1 Tax=Microlunatus sp. GCM10028923 TaxID=3273400 RepID=UPI003617F5EC
MVATGSGGRPALLRRHNQALILDALRRAGDVTRPELARRTGLAWPTVSRLVDDLIGRGLVEDTGHTEPGRGRPATTVRLRPTGAYAVGGELDRQGIRLVVTDLHGTVRGAAELDRGDEPAAELRAMAGRVEALLADIGVPAERVLGIGLGVPGQLDPERGLLVGPAHLPGWSQVPIVALLSDLLPYPVTVDNDANLAAVGEFLLGGHRARNLVSVYAGSGIGAGLVLDGRLYRGRANGVGELGHCTIDPAGPACFCGRSGCVEVFASTGAMAVSAGLPGFAELLAEEAAGVPAARSALRFGGEHLGLGLAHLINLLDPDLVVLAGEAAASTTFEVAVFEAMRRHTFLAGSREIEARRSALGRDAVAQGAAATVLTELFESPLGQG